jgi:signal transduction histidine kinase
MSRAGAARATWSFVVSVLIALGAVRGMVRLSAPLDDLADAAERIERGDYSARVGETGPFRMRSLARAFNGMSARLAAVDAGRRAFLADAAHELRTPLSIIEGQIEAIEDGLYPADKEHLAPIHDQMRLLEKLIEDIRTVAIAEAGALSLDARAVDLADLIEQVVADFQTEAGSAGVSLAADDSPRLPDALGDEQRVRQVRSNLLSNALRHTPSGGHVRVAARVARDGGALEVSVLDDGSGIAPDLLPHVFDRFFKEPGSTGSGLGLAICRDLVAAQAGTIGITSEPGRGTTVTFTLPFAAPRPA